MTACYRWSSQSFPFFKSTSCAVYQTGQIQHLGSSGDFSVKLSRAPPCTWACCPEVKRERRECMHISSIFLYRCRRTHTDIYVHISLHKLLHNTRCVRIGTWFVHRHRRGHMGPLVQFWRMQQEHVHSHMRAPTCRCQSIGAAADWSQVDWAGKLSPLPVKRNMRHFHLDMI